MGGQGWRDPNEAYAHIRNSEGQEIWKMFGTGPGGGYARKVPMQQFLDALKKYFDNKTSASRKLNKEDQEYIKTQQLLKRYDVKDNLVSIDVMGGERCKQYNPPNCYGFWHWFREFAHLINKCKDLYSQHLVYGLITKPECEEILKIGAPGSIIIRFSDSQPGCPSM